MNMKLTIPFALIGASLATAAVAAGGPTYTIHFRPTLHKHLHYGMQMNMGKMAVTAKFTITAVSFSGGKYTVVTKYDSMTIPGAPPETVKQMLDGMTFTQVVDQNGKVLSTKASGMAGPMASSGLTMNGAIYGGKPVHVGDSWMASSSVRGHTETVRIKLLNVSGFGGGQLATLQVTPTSTAGKDMPVVITVDTATGTLHTMKMTGTSRQGPMTALVKLQ